MEYIVSQAEMKRYDEQTISFFQMPAMTLMERAALSVVEHIECTGRERILILCGSGNNGGDGFAVARLLLLKGQKVQVLFVGKKEHLSDSCRMQWEIYKKYADTLQIDEPIVTEWPDDTYDIIIDAIFGIGLNRPVKGYADEIINKANSCNATKIALDIPSGIHADTGQILGCAFRADVTETFAFTKRGLLLYPGVSYAGEIRCNQIGITKESFLENPPQAFSYDKTDIVRLPQRKADGNKGSFGKIGFFTGCAAISGAAVLSAEAAYRMGCGYVKVMTHFNSRAEILHRIPEAVVSYYEDDTDFKTRLSMLKDIVNFSDVIAVGAGIGMDEWAECMVRELIMLDQKPIIIDADACNIIAESEKLQNYLLQTAFKRKYPIIMTPHLAEFARLSGKEITAIKADFAKAVLEFSRTYGIILAAKDATSLVTDGQALYFNRSGNDALATAGSGDVLFGMIAALTGQKMEAFEAACLGCYLHGLCGDLACDKTNARFVTASDLTIQLADILK